MKPKAGFTLVEVMVSVAISVISSLAVIYILQMLVQYQVMTSEMTNVESFRQQLIVNITNDQAFANTIAQNSTGGSVTTPTMDCISNGTPCTTTGLPGGAPLSPQLMAIYDNTNKTVFDSTVATNGLTAQGALCNTYNIAGTPLCPLRYSIRWSPSCTTGNCVNPQILIQATFSNSDPNLKLPLDVSSYNFSLYKNVVVPPCPRGWTKKTPAVSPAPLIDQVAAYDSQRDSVILYGGNYNSGMGGGPVSADMWEYKNNNWTQLCTNCAPGQRMRSVMVYDNNRNRLILFGGGTDYPTADNQVWEWDGTIWKQNLSIVGTPPSARSAAYAAYDSARKRMVIFGGIQNTWAKLNDTYEYDGARWYGPFAPLTKPPLSMGASNGAFFDSIHSLTMFIGAASDTGNPGTIYYDDLWAWDGVNWMNKCPNCIGSPRSGAYVDFDPQKSLFVIAQGFAYGAEMTGTFEIDTNSYAVTNVTSPRDPMPARDSGTLTFVPTLGGFIYFGGNTCGVNCNYNETWQFCP